MDSLFFTCWRGYFYTVLVLESIGVMLSAESGFWSLLCHDDADDAFVLTSVEVEKLCH